MLPVVFYYHRLNKYSFNALAGALDVDPVASAVHVIRGRTHDEVNAAVAEQLKSNERVVAGLSIMTPQLQDAAALLRQLRDNFGDRALTIAGGPHATAAPTDLLALGADIVFRGEAETAFPAFMATLVNDHGCRNSDRVILNRTGPVDIEAFASFSPKRGMFGPIEITRGCPFACSYCQTSSIFGVRVRHRSVASIVRQALTLKPAKRNVRLLSPNAFSYGSPDGRELNLPAIRDLLQALRAALDRNDQITFAHFPSEVRPEHVTRETLELLREFADNKEIVIGAQSGSQRMLDACHRGHDVACILNAVTQARKSGYAVIIDFILGLPGETPEDARQTAAVIREVARMGARIHPHAFVPLPHTAFASEPPGIISPDLIHALDQLKPQRGIYGDWVPQRLLAQHVYKTNAKTHSRKTAK